MYRRINSIPRTKKYGRTKAKSDDFIKNSKNKVLDKILSDLREIKILNFWALEVTSVSCVARALVRNCSDATSVVHCQVYY